MTYDDVTSQERKLSGALALVMHLMFLALLIFGVSWQKKHVDSTMIVELWSNLPPLPQPQAEVTPPPPPNQIVLVTPQHPFKLAETYQLATVSGTLKPGFEKTQLFIMDGVAVIQSGYSVGSAVVATAKSSPVTGPPRKATPWNFLNK